MTFPLGAHTIFLGLAGSHAHGTAGEHSDVDLRGVCIAPLSTRLSLFRTFEQYEGPLDDDLASRVMPALQAHPTAARGLAVKIETTIFDLAKFVRLCAQANPNTLEILFTDERDWLLATPAWRKLHASRHRFLTRKIHQTFHGYAMAQLKKIQTHRSWLLSPPAAKPSRERFGLPETGTLGREDRDRIEQAIADRMRSYGLADVEMPKPARIALQERLAMFWRDAMALSAEDIDEGLRTAATASLSLPSEVVTALAAERKYRAALRHYEAYEAWKAQRNRARAELEREHGYDTKHAMHLVRLMTMGLEALQRGELSTRREDAAALLEIRRGALSFDEVLAMASQLEADMEVASAGTSLPADVDREEVDRLAFELMTAPEG